MGNSSENEESMTYGYIVSKDGLSGCCFATSTGKHGLACLARVICDRMFFIIISPKSSSYSY
jgi:hypothetical protein